MPKYATTMPTTKRVTNVAVLILRPNFFKGNANRIRITPMMGIGIVLENVPQAYLHMKALPTEPFIAIATVPMKVSTAVRKANGIHRIFSSANLS
jgi:hypothetical protein